MKRRLILIALCTFAFAAASCRKDDGNIRTPDNDMSETAKVIITKDGSNEETVTLFSKTAVYRKSELEGKSHFMASSGGKMVYDACSLSFIPATVMQPHMSTRVRFRSQTKVKTRSSYILTM